MYSVIGSVTIIKNKWPWQITQFLKINLCTLTANKNSCNDNGFEEEDFNMKDYFERFFASAVWGHVPAKGCADDYKTSMITIVRDVEPKSNKKEEEDQLNIMN